MKIDSDKQFNTESLLTTKARCLLIDIEGTTSSVQYVYDVLFPFARKAMANYLKENWQSAEVQKAIEYLAKELGFDSAREWFDNSATPTGNEADLLDKLAHADEEKGGVSAAEQADPKREAEQELVLAEVNRLMDQDAKSTGLKELQGLIWATGYAEGDLTSHVFADVPVALKAWKQAGLDVRIFSSGSINAQKVFFKNTEHGDLTEYLRGHYDTTTGPKRESQTYKLIAEDLNLEPKQILFLSDVLAELEAAKEAGMQVALVSRPGNAPVDRQAFALIETFDQICIV